MNCPKCGIEQKSTLTDQCHGCGADNYGRPTWKERAEKAEAQIEELRRELDDLKAQGALAAEAIRTAESVLTSFSTEELEPLGPTLPDLIVDAGHTLTGVIERLSEIEPGTAEAKAQRYEEALDEDGAVMLAIREALGDELEQSEDWSNLEGEEFIPNDPAVEVLGDRLCEAARKALSDEEGE